MSELLTSTPIVDSKETDDLSRYQESGAYHWSLASYHPLKGNSFARARYSNVIELAEKFVPDGLSGKNILDHGCGDGVLSRLLSNKNAQVFGMDLSPLAINFARERTQGMDIEYQCASASDLPYLGGAFDGVISTQVIEHLDTPQEMLGEIFRVLKPGGFAIITTRIKLSETPLDPTHVTEWFEYEFQRLIESTFGNGIYLSSHPVFWMEASYRFPFLKYLFNLISLIHNPFSGFKTSFRYNVIQYAVVFK